MSICMNERTTRRVNAILTDEDDVGIDVADITSVVMTLYNKADGSIINSRTVQDIKNANDVTIDSVGALVWIVQVLDNVIVDSKQVLEHHIALIEWTWSAGNHEGRYTIDIFIRNMEKVP